MIARFLILVALVLGCGTSRAVAEVSFVREIAPILVKRCTGCHGDKRDLGNYRVHTFAGLLRPGASEAKPVVAGKPDASEFYRRLVHKSPALRMPQADDPLSPPQLALVRRWIAEGAKFDGADRAAALKSLLGPRQHPAAPTAYRAAVPVLALAFAPGGKELAVGGYNEVTLWNATTGALVRRIGGLPQRIHALAYARDGKRLLVAGGTPGDYGEVALVDAATGKRQVLDTFDDIVLAAAFSQDGRQVAAGGADATVRAYEIAGGKRLWTNKVHSDWVTGVGFSSDGQFVASSSKDFTVKVYDARNGALFTTYNGHNRNYGKYRGQFPVYTLQFAGDQLLACSAGAGPTLQLWDPVKARGETGDAGDMEERFQKPSHARHIEHGFKHEVFGLAVRNGQVFAASADGVVKQFDLKTLGEVRAFKGHADWVYAVDYDPTTGRVATGAYDGEVRLWDPKTGDCTLAFQARPGAVARTR